MIDPSASATAEPAEAPSSAGGRHNLPAPSWALIGIFLLLALQALAYARSFFIPVVLGLLLTLIFSPLRRGLGRIGVPSGVAAFLIVTVLMAGLLAAGLTLTAPAREWVEQAPAIGREFEEKLQDLRGTFEGVREVAKQVDSLGEGGTEPGADTAERVVVDEPGNAATIALATPGVLAQMLFTLILAFFMLSSGDMFYEKLVHVMPTFHDKRLAVRIAYDIERKLSRYLLTITTINAGLGIAIGCAMWALGMPNPLLFGVVGFLLNYVPYVGALLGVIITVGVGLVSLETAQGAGAAGLVYYALTTFEGQFVTPYFVGRSLQLNTVVIFLSVTLWAWLWSVVGMLVATPMLVSIRTVCEHIPALNPLGDFLSARGAERDTGPAGSTTGSPLAKRFRG